MRDNLPRRENLDFCRADFGNRQTGWRVQHVPVEGKFLIFLRQRRYIQGELQRIFIHQPEGLFGPLQRHFGLLHRGGVKMPSGRQIFIRQGNEKITAHGIPLITEGRPQQTGQTDGDYFFLCVFTEPGPERSFFRRRSVFCVVLFQDFVERRGAGDDGERLSLGDGDAPALFGHDNAQGIRSLRQSERGRVAQAHVSVSRGIDGQGQMTAEHCHAVVFEDRRPVVARGVRIEKAFQKRLARGAVQGDAAVQMAVQRIISLDDQQGADALLGKIARGFRDDVRGFLQTRQGRRLFAELAQHGDALKEAAKIFLKDHHQHEQQNGEEPLEYDHGEIELEKPGGQIHAAQKQNADQNKSRRPGFEPHQEGENHSGDDRHIQDVLNSDVFDDGCSGVDHIHDGTLPV